ncbi:MAG: hypothetical protein DMG49_08360, partial [Acidobacteria bacterium]
PEAQQALAAYQKAH